MTAATGVFSRIDQLKEQLDSLRPLPRDVEDRVMQKFRLWWTYHSNAIEGNKLTQGETTMFLMEGLTAKGKPLKDHLDLKGHAEAIEYLLRFVRNHDALTEAAIRELHKVLLVEPYTVPAITPDGNESSKVVAIGQYKTSPNHVRTVTGETHYYATPAETPAKMHDLMNWLRDSLAGSDMHLVEIAARFHHRFTGIHPFDDGNGRMARLLMNLLLMRSGYPPVVIRLAEKDDYLFALRKADLGEAKPFIHFIAERVAGSLDLYHRGVTGEDIHEPTDVDKEIALLRMQLQHKENPEPRSLEAQKLIVQQSLDFIFKRFKQLTVPLIEFFSAEKLHLSGSQVQGADIDVTQSLNTTAVIPVPDRIWLGGVALTHLHLKVDFLKFQKARYDTFDIRCGLTVRFDDFKYSVSVDNTRLSVPRFYQEQLSPEQINQIAEAMARQIITRIKEAEAKP